MQNKPVKEKPKPEEVQYSFKPEISKRAKELPEKVYF